MAANSLQTQLQVVRMAVRKPLAMRQLLIHSSLITSAALTFEALVLARKHMPLLRKLIEPTVNGPALLKAMGALTSGKHPASGSLNLARNQLGFHWDADVIVPAVQDYARNKSVVWLEFGADDIIYHRLAGEVLTYTLLPRAQGLKQADLRVAIVGNLVHITEAMKTINRFFAACIFAFFENHRSRVRRRFRETQRRSRAKPKA